MSAKAWIGIVLMILAFMVIPATIVISMSADTQYNRLFKSHETMFHDAANFEMMRNQLIVIWTNMNETWTHPEDWEYIYNTWWGPDQNYENSLQATQDYFTATLERIDQTVAELEEIKTGNKTILQPYNAYYQQQLDELVSETTEAGGLLWVINGAWYMQNAPLVYYAIWWAAPTFAILFFAGLVIAIYYWDE